MAVSADFNRRNRVVHGVAIASISSQFNLRNFILNNHTNYAMISFFKQNRVTTLQRKYDKLMKEAYELRTNRELSQQKQLEAQAVQREIINRSV